MNAPLLETLTAAHRFVRTNAVTVADHQLADRVRDAHWRVGALINSLKAVELSRGLDVGLVEAVRDVLALANGGDA